MDLIIDGWDVFWGYKEGIFVFFVTVMGLGGWGAKRLYPHHQFSPPEMLLVDYGLGTLLLIWISVVLVLAGRLWLPVLTIGSLLVPLLSMVLLINSYWGRWRSVVSKLDFRICVIAGSSLFVYFLARLAFLGDLILPPYDDSPEHYMIIRDFLGANQGNQNAFYSLGRISEHYYHFGFHALATWLTAATAGDPTKSMLLLGQIFVYLSCISIFLFVLALSGSVPAGISGALFAALAWRMPAFAANWGKYPALTGLALLPAWLGIMILSNNLSKRKFSTYLLSIFVILGLGLIHTRLLVVLSLGGTAYLVCGSVNIKWISSRLQVPIHAVFLIAILSLFYKTILVYYSTFYWAALGLLVLLLPFAIVSFPRFILWISFTMLGIWFSTRIQLPFEGYGARWLDQPFIEMVLYIPLSLLAGVGVAGALKRLSDYPAIINKLVVALPAALLLFGSFSSDTYHPDECCNYVGGEDMAAIRWLDQNASEAAVIWTAGFKPNNYMIGTDAGVWIYPLTGRNVNKLPYDFDWNSPPAAGKICQTGYKDVYVYKGAMPFSFDDFNLEGADWLEPVFRDGNTRIYRINCS